MLLYSDEPMSTMLIKGIILWRPVNFNKNFEATLAEVKFEKTDKETFIGRMFLNGDFSWEPQVYSARHEDGSSGRGIVCFIKDQPRDDWTHLILNGVSKSLQIVNGGSGAAVFAENVIPYK